MKKALHKVDQDDFGYCSECGKAIPLGRILLLPHTEYCVNCAE